MAFGFRIATLLLAIFLILGVLSAEITSRTDVSFTALVSRSSSDTLKTLWKRRRGGGSGSDSDSDSDSGSDSDDSSSGGDSGGWYTCYREENITREAHNDGSYGDYYSLGNGSENSTAGGYTPEGSGSRPRWDNSSGSWVALSSWEPSYLDDPEYISYLGGAAVPYLAGETSPNGMTAEEFTDLPYEPDLSQIPSDLLCQVPNSSFAYRYEAEFNWTSLSLEQGAENYGEYVTRFVPVYCCCARYTLCGCDDFHRNSSFVAKMLEEAGIGQSPRNTSGVCSIELEGETTILVGGTLTNGSTKADQTVEYLTETVSTTVSTTCLAGTGGADEASGGRVYGPSGTAVVVAWVATLGAGVLFGMCLVLL
ncbi:hypothetical protein BDW59DRAFT_168904 [Aspergillus cavernicola]|uniref:DUF7732 domain-containing protein n=1 Tax=Aspergillus cavernicola TaxID=176166 RepID=A0ABR4J1K9_9EURO